MRSGRCEHLFICFILAVFKRNNVARDEEGRLEQIHFGSRTRGLRLSERAGVLGPPASHCLLGSAWKVLGTPPWWHLRWGLGHGLQEESQDESPLGLWRSLLGRESLEEPQRLVKSTQAQAHHVWHPPTVLSEGAAWAPLLLLDISFMLLRLRDTHIEQSGLGLSPRDHNG